MTEPSPVRLVTQHNVVVYDDDEIVVRVPVSGPMARIAERPLTAGDDPLASSAGPIRSVFFGYAARIIGLPEPKPGVASQITSAARPRPDVFFPDVRTFEVGGRHAGGT